MKTSKMIAGFLLLIAGSKANAQMGEAQKMTFDKDTVVHFNAGRETVWKLIKDPAKWNELSNGTISSISTKGDLGSTMQRTIAFADGTSRVDEVSQYMPEYRFIVNRVISPLPKGVGENLYMFSLDVDPGKGSIMKYMIKVDGDGEGKKALLETLQKEMNVFITAVQRALNP